MEECVGQHFPEPVKDEHLNYIEESIVKLFPANDLAAKRYPAAVQAVITLIANAYERDERLKDDIRTGKRDCMNDLRGKLSAAFIHSERLDDVDFAYQVHNLQILDNPAMRKKLKYELQCASTQHMRYCCEGCDFPRSASVYTEPNLHAKQIR